MVFYSMINMYDTKLYAGDIARAAQKIYSSAERAKLEHFFERLLDRASIALGSGSDALYIALQQIKKSEKGKGGEVIIPNYSCKAIPRAVIAAGFKPVFVDINNSISMEIDLVKKAVTKDTRTIIAAGTRKLSYTKAHLYTKFNKIAF